jgi:uncharacterized repeat protein (TIGR03803 family)
VTKLARWKKVAAVFLGCGVVALTASAQVFTTLANFNGVDGAIPMSMSLVQGLDGNLYGTTENGGYGFGTVFRITSQGSIAAYKICNRVSCGEGPQAGVVLATDGYFYGTTPFSGHYGAGTIFKIAPDGTFMTLHNFDFNDGANSNTPLIQATDGNLYGTTSAGGANNAGTVFKITPGGRLTTLHSFCQLPSCSDGRYSSGLLQATDGNFYGTTSSGGAYYLGSVFKITRKGTLTTLYSFCPTGVPPCPDGSSPTAGLVEGTDGNFYGTTGAGGTGSGSLCGPISQGCGTIFKLTPDGTLTTLHNFDSNDGFGPGSLVQATNGNFYGTTPYGGEAGCFQKVGCGVIFEVTPQGGFTTLHTFGSSDGGDPIGGLVQSTDGNLYGSTAEGGTHNVGTIFKLDVGLGPFVTFISFAGKIGQTCPILGQGFTGTTSVSFNGMLANFTVISDTYISATVPEGATTGYVLVKAPSGALTSNVPFHVLP